jgi:hypothetical protein
MLMHCAPPSARLTVHIALVLASTLLLFPTAAMAEPGQMWALTDSPLPNGLVVVIGNKPQEDQSLDLRALNNPFISGVARQIKWRDIEPVQGKPDWSKLDQLFAAAESSKKWVQLLIFPGFFSPPWALEGAKTELFAMQYGPGKGTVESLPMPWDRVYLDRWFAFLKQLSDRYGKSPAFRVVAADGPTSVSAEFTLPNAPKDIKTWLNDSYTPPKYIGAWQEVFQFFASHFPNQYVFCQWALVFLLMPRVKSILVSICAPGKQLSTTQLASWDADLHCSIAISMEMQARAEVLAALV